MRAGTLIVVLLVFAAAVGAMRRDPRFDRRETAIQAALIAAYLAACALAAVAMPPVATRVGVVPALLLCGGAILLMTIALARCLKRRLDQRPS